MYDSCAALKLNTLERAELNARVREEVSLSQSLSIKEYICLKEMKKNWYYIDAD